LVLAVVVAVLATGSGGAVQANSCQYTLVESIPQHFQLQSRWPQTYDTWLKMIQSAQTSIDIASFYWSLVGGSNSLGGSEGADIFTALIIAIERGVHVRIIQTMPSPAFPQNDTAYLASLGSNVEVRSIDMPKFFQAGIVHTKFMIVDRSSLYVGSANYDWRSLSQVKELGIAFQNCANPAGEDLTKIFEVYWTVAKRNTLPSYLDWPKNTWTDYTFHHPAPITISPMSSTADSESGHCSLASAPKEFCPPARTSDLDAILWTIAAAKTSICISVMDYSPSFLYTSKPRYWSVIDQALRTAAFDRGVKIRLLMSKWNYTNPTLYAQLRSLANLCNNSACASVGGSLDVKLFVVPDDPAGSSPHTRVNHAKYMVTDSSSYIGTSNWSADYFISTAGVGIVLDHAMVRGDLQGVFDRDWNSQFVVPLP